MISPSQARFVSAESRNPEGGKHVAAYILLGAVHPEALGRRTGDRDSTLI